MELPDKPKSASSFHALATTLNKRVEEAEASMNNAVMFAEQEIEEERQKLNLDKLKGVLGTHQCVIHYIIDWNFIACE
ncbi:hypothetical protein QE152_g874 [Popillia japonica]|uniref:Uncharacterized protein n=1 Tax=Popillia japonica TaxID=7064 RepID=A0AAW1N4K2_POPJA